ncbi:hypothetical protein ACDY97_19180 [Rhizobium mongolense]
MTVFFTWLLRTIGIGGVAFLGLYIYDWGIPGAGLKIGSGRMMR